MVKKHWDIVVNDFRSLFGEYEFNSSSHFGTTWAICTAISRDNIAYSTSDIYGTCAIEPVFLARRPRYNTFQSHLSLHKIPSHMLEPGVLKLGTYIHMLIAIEC